MCTGVQSRCAVHIFLYEVPRLTKEKVEGAAFYSEEKRAQSRSYTVKLMQQLKHMLTRFKGMHQS